MLAAGRARLPSQQAAVRGGTTCWVSSVNQTMPKASTLSRAGAHTTGLRTINSNIGSSSLHDAILKQQLRGPPVVRSLSTAPNFYGLPNVCWAQSGAAGRVISKVCRSQPRAPLSVLRPRVHSRRLSTPPTLAISRSATRGVRPAVPQGTSVKHGRAGVGARAGNRKLSYNVQGKKSGQGILLVLCGVSQAALSPVARLPLHRTDNRQTT